VERALVALVKAITERARAHELKRLEARRGESTPQPEPPAVPTATSEVRNDRRALVDAFIKRYEKETGSKLKKQYIWRAVRYKAPRQFQYWQASHPRATPHDDPKFRGILAMSPTEFKALLETMRII
jgi:hypothetical protein